MGGFGSTRWGGHVPKTTVEECLSLSMDVVGQLGALQARTPCQGTIRWSSPHAGKVVARAGFAFRPLGEASERDGHLRLRYATARSAGSRSPGSGRDGEATAVEQEIPLDTTPCNFGGERWWFRCPRPGEGPDGAPCERRCFKLYLPPDAQGFGCRECHDLTYESAQTAHEFDTLFAHLADEMDLPTGDVKALLRGGPPGA